MPPKRKGGATAGAAKSKKGKKDEELAAAEAGDQPDDDVAQASKPETEVTTSSSTESETFESDAKTNDGRAWNFKISSWNVGGIRAWLKKDGLAYLEKENPDIMVLQETKCSEAQLPADVKNVPGYDAYWYSPESKSGYSGVGILTKMKPIKVSNGIGVEEHDKEGRLITAEYENFYLVAVYVPNSGRGLVRLAYRRQWNEDLLAYLKDLDSKKPVIIAGDLNVAHNPIDIARPDSNKKSAGFTKEEREDFTTWLGNGFIDSFRRLYPKEEGAYTFWSYLNNARAKNVGWRLDYFILSERLADNLCDNVIRSKVMGSDHCPLTLLMHF